MSNELTLTFRKTAYEFHISGGTVLGSFLGPGEVMLPKVLSVVFKDGQFDEAALAGPRLNARGKELKQWHSLRYARRDINPGPEATYRMPDFVRTVVETITMVTGNAPA